MADQRRVPRVRLAFIQQGLQPPRGPIKEEGFDSIGHILFYHSTQPSALSHQQETLTATDAKAAKELELNVNSFAYFAPLAVNRCWLNAEG